MPNAHLLPLNECDYIPICWCATLLHHDKYQLGFDLLAVATKYNCLSGGNHFFSMNSTENLVSKQVRLTLRIRILKTHCSSIFKCIIKRYKLFIYWNLHSDHQRRKKEPKSVLHCVEFDLIMTWDNYVAIIDVFLSWSAIVRESKYDFNNRKKNNYKPFSSSLEWNARFLVWFLGAKELLSTQSIKEFFIWSLSRGNGQQPNTQLHVLGFFFSLSLFASLY